MINLFYTHNKFLRLPADFSEVTRRQIIRLCPLMFAGGDEVVCKVSALRILSGLGIIRWRLLPADVIRRSLEYISWIFDPANRRGLTRQLIPWHRGRVGPAGEFDNLKMCEFHFTELFYRDYLRTGEESYLNKLVAALYRLPKKDYDRRKNPAGDTRIPFNENLVDHDARIVRRWPADIRQTIFTWYDACRQQLKAQYPAAFEDYSDFISEFDTGLYGMMRSLAGERLGKISDIEELYVHHAFLEIGLLREEERYMDSQIKKVKQRQS